MRIWYEYNQEMSQSVIAANIFHLKEEVKE